MTTDCESTLAFALQVLLFFPLVTKIWFNRYIRKTDDTFFYSFLDVDFFKCFTRVVTLRVLFITKKLLKRWKNKGTCC